MRTKEETRVNANALIGRGLLGGGALGIVAILVLMAPAAMAVGPATFQHAPYLNAQAVQQTRTTLVGPSASVVTLLPGTFSLTTGAVRDQVVASVASSTGGPNLAITATTLGLSGLDFTTATAGAHLITVGWTMGFHGQMSVTPGILPRAPGLASMVVITATVYLLETSTGLAVPGTTATVTLYNHLLTTGLLPYGQAPTLVQFGPMPVSLPAGHTYAVYTVVQLSVAAMVNPGAPLHSSVTTTLTVEPGSVLTYVAVA